jgi:signal peptide peptidase SppA
MKRKYEYWLGDEGSLATYQKVQENSLDPNLRIQSNNQQESSHILSQHGSVAVISIQGGLLPFSNWMTQMMGLTGYPDIRDALVEAAQDDTIDQILLDINSPGGSASGIEDISSLIAKIDKPITSYTNGTMASAAYWIGASADKVFASSLSSVGSIGVIATHFDETKALDMAGVKPTVFRSGEFKALGGPYETLSAQAITTIQSRLDSLYTAFVSHIADVRHTSATVVHDKMADGREFLGHEALQAGLIDGIMSIDDLMVKLSSTKPSNGRTQNTRMEASEMARKLLSEKAAAVLAAGGEIDASLETVTEPVIEVPAVVEETPAVEEVAAAVVVPAAEDASLVSYLKAELSSVNEKLLTASMETRNLQAKLDAITVTHDSMRSIVCDSINNKTFPVSGNRLDLSALPDEALVQQYQHASAEFSKTFPIGGKSILPSVEQPEVMVDPAHAARIKASKI